MSGFWLRKWYLDAADARGNVYIGYWAAVQWKSLTLSYYQHLWHTTKDGVTCTADLAALPSPDWYADSELRWNTPQVQAAWNSKGIKELSETLLQTDQGEIHWRCLQPKALATIQSSRLSFSGWGYTECIDISIPAWKLPLQTLYWGRGHSDSHYMVWIKWDGVTDQCLLWHDGDRCTQFTLSDTEIAAQAMTLELEASTTLRRGVIQSTVFGSLGRVASLFPNKALLVHEHKSYGKGTIITPGSSEPATVIYERVEW